MSDPCFPPATAERLGKRFCALLEDYDHAAARALLTPDIVLWQNFTKREMSGEQVFAFLSAVFTSLPLIRYREIRCTPTVRGWVQQHVVDSDTPDGKRVRDLPCCLVITTEGERIRRIEEYLDHSYAVLR